jgi:hypothetical protein
MPPCQSESYKTGGEERTAEPTGATSTAMRFLRGVETEKIYLS